MYSLQIHSTFTELTPVKDLARHNSSSGPKKRSYLQLNVFLTLNL